MRDVVRVRARAGRSVIVCACVRVGVRVGGRASRRTGGLGRAGMLTTGHSGSSMHAPCRAARARSRSRPSRARESCSPSAPASGKRLHSRQGSRGTCGRSQSRRPRGHRGASPARGLRAKPHRGGLTRPMSLRRAMEGGCKSEPKDRGELRTPSCGASPCHEATPARQTCTSRARCEARRRCRAQRRRQTRPAARRERTRQGRLARSPDLAAPSPSSART